jgi:hypothetical protein
LPPETQARIRPKLELVAMPPGKVRHAQGVIE